MKYPANSLSPTASPRLLGPTRSIFMITATDQVRPWFTPSRTLAATIHSHEGASMIMNGTGIPTIQPATKTFLRPNLSAKDPETRLENALTSPKEAMKEKMAVLRTSPNCSDPMSGTTVLSMPTMPPTKALTSISSANCRQFSLSPKRTREDGTPRVTKVPSLASRATVRAVLQLGWGALRGCPRPVQFDDALEVGRRGRDATRYPLHEGVLLLAQDRQVLAHLRQRRADRLTVERDGLARVSRQDQRLGLEGEEASQGAVEIARLLAGAFRRGVQVGAAHRRQEQRVPGEHGPPVQEVARALGRMPRRPYGLAVGPDDVGQSPLPGTAHLHHLGLRPCQGYFGRVPREAPGLHPTFQ